MRVLRRFNYTDRKKIRKTDVDITLIEQPGMPPRFEAVLRLSHLGLPGEAPVFIEAYQSEIMQRFYWGTVSDPKPSCDTSLRDLDETRPVRFRVKVVDPSGNHGRLLAAAFAITPKGDEPDEEGRQSIIDIKVKELDEVPYRIEFPDGERIQLTLNSRIPYAKDRLRQDPVFQAFIFPAIIRETLYRIFLKDDRLLESDTEGNGDDESWQGRWLMFAKRLYGDMEYEPSADNIDEFIDKVIEKFSKSYKLCERLVGRLENIS